MIVLLPAACCLLLLLVMQPLLANDTLQELVVAFYDQQGQLTSKVSFIIQVQGSKPSSYSSSSSSSACRLRQPCSLPPHTLLVTMRVQSTCSEAEMQAFHIPLSCRASTVLHSPLTGLAWSLLSALLC
jgi:hypothetical protein